MGEFSAFLAAKGKTRPGVMIYFALVDQLKEYTKEEIGDLFLAILSYAQFGVIPSFTDRGMRVIWRELVRKIDVDGDKWEQKTVDTLYMTYAREYKKRFGEGQTVPDKESWIVKEIERLVANSNDVSTSGYDTLTCGDQMQDQSQKAIKNYNSHTQKADAEAEGKGKGDEGGDGKGSDKTKWEEVAEALKKQSAEDFEERRRAGLALLDGVMP